MPGPRLAGVAEAVPALPPGWPAMSIAEAHERLTAPDGMFAIETREIRGVPTTVWKNSAPSLRATVEIARWHGEKTFLVHEDERVTYAAFARAVAALAQAMLEDGVRKGDRVAIAMRNLPEWPVAFYAAASVGAIVTPLNAWWTGSELEYALAHSGARLAVLDGERWARIADRLAACPELARIYVSRTPTDLPAQATRLETIIGPPSAWAGLPDAPLPAVALDPEDDATLFYTSGTSGRPKGALATHRAATSAVLTTGAALMRGYLRRGQAAPGFSPTARQRAALLTVPLFHVTGCLVVLNPMAMLGAKVVLMRRWDPLEAFQLIERERINAVGNVPTVAWQLSEHPAREQFDLSSLDYVSYGGAPAAPDLVRCVRDAFPQVQLAQGWGMTETCGTVTSNTAEDYLARPGSCGVAAPVALLEVRDPADGVRVLAPGEVGELWAFGPMNGRGYWRDPEASARTFVDGWVRTGDLATLDEEGFCTIVDRARDMLIRGGENIYCVEVENALCAHPAVAEAAVVGTPHRTLGEEPVAVVTLRSGAEASEDDLRRHVGQRLAAYKVPVRVIAWRQPLPRNANGKVLKDELKALFEGG